MRKNLVTDFNNPKLKCKQEMVKPGDAPCIIFDHRSSLSIKSSPYSAGIFLLIL